ncbi:MAG: TatD family hydrolase [Candidatus Thorarchaeota archaeon]
MVGCLRIADTHCHLEAPEFATDLDEVIEEAVRSGIHMITSAIREDAWERAIDISLNHDSVSLALGLDPILSYQVKSTVEIIKGKQEQLVAIGEVGLDHYRERNHKKREEQENSFRLMIELAKETHLPLQVHSRSAGRRSLEVLRSTEAERVQMHAFDGKASLARVASTEYGYYFSIPTSVVRSAQKKKLVKAVDIERILVETDSPVLGPDGESRNEPSNVWVALREVASILGREEEEMRKILLENTLRLYPGIKTK